MRSHYRILSAAVTAAALCSGGADASPWFSAGDPRLRSALQQLADQRHLDRTVTTWPIMAESVSGGLSRQQAMSDDHALMALGELSTKSEPLDAEGLRAELRIAGISDQMFVRGFDDGSRDSGAGVAVEYRGGNVSARLDYTRAVRPADAHEDVFDGSFLAGQFSNVSVGAGYVDRWWGPGWQSSLVLSNNARPIPAVFASRVDERPFDVPVLKYLGPWQFSVFAGQLESQRAVPDARMVGMRFTLRPLPGLDIGLSRSFTFGGGGQLESSEALWHALTGRSDEMLDGQPVADQTGSVDVRYGFALGELTAGLYGQMMGEDESGLMPSSRSWLFGSDLKTSLGRTGQQWFLEYSNTLARDLFHSDTEPRTAYENSNWETGYRHRGRNMASTFEGDSRNVTAGVFHFLDQGMNLGLSVSHVELNVADEPVQAAITDPEITYFMSESDQNMWIVHASYGLALEAGELDVSVQWLSESIDRPTGGEQKEISAGISYRYRW